MRSPTPISEARFEKPFILISIADEGDDWEKHSIPDSPMLVEAVKLNFHEQSPETRSTWNDQRTLRTHRCFSARDAIKILDLLTRRLNEVAEVVVVCEAGLYRSIVFADAIAQLIGAPLIDKWGVYDPDWLKERLLWHAKRRRWEVPKTK
jgi:hypothetical protein